MNWKVILKSLTDKDMQRRVLIVIGILVAYRILSHVPIPMAEAQTMRQVLETLFTSGDVPQFLQFVNVLSGNALLNFSIMIVGLMPYINASIIMQMLTRAVPKLEKINKEGEFGRKKINQMTRMLTLPLAVIQSVGVVYLVGQGAAQVAGIGNIAAEASIMQWILMVSALTGGSMMLMWMGELITEQGIGNGISLLITVGIIASLPGIITALASGMVASGNKISIFGAETPFNLGGTIVALSLLLAVIFVIVIVVRLNEAAKRETVNYAKRVQGNRTYGGVTTVLPVKMITAGVIPIIFAVAFLSIPTFAGQIMENNHNETIRNLGNIFNEWFAYPSPETFAMGGWQPFVYPIAYFALVFLFTFFYTQITFNSKDIAENLQKQGGFISGVRSGLQTEKYLSKVVNRLTVFGATALGLLALTPIIGQFFVDQSVAIEGTAILILVSVSLDTLRRVESRALMITFDTYEGGDFFEDVGHIPQEEQTKKSRLKLPKIKRG